MQLAGIYRPNSHARNITWTFTYVSHLSTRIFLRKMHTFSYRQIHFVTGNIVLLTWQESFHYFIQSNTQMSICPLVIISNSASVFGMWDQLAHLLWRFYDRSSIVSRNFVGTCKGLVNHVNLFKVSLVSKTNWFKTSNKILIELY